MKLCFSVLCIIFIALVSVVHSERSQGGRWYNPVANPKAIVQINKARFTVLTSSLIRVEYSYRGQFEDRSSIAILNRNVPVPTFTLSSGTCNTITTETLVLTYCPNQDNSNGFTSTSLRIATVSGASVPFSWVPGTVDSGNLHGTIRTLEGKDGAGPHELNCSLVPPDSPTFATHCTEGLISKNGWTLVDDTPRALLDGDVTWDWVVPRDPNATSVTDWYFFGYGHNFKQALYDFTLLAGKIPLPPRYTFGIFWSRYWAFSDKGEKEIVQEYQTHDTPLDVLVVDMDWHITFYKEAFAGKKDQAGQTVGWTGYTWDANLFPNSKDFLDWVANKGLHVTLNLHPASGVQPHELRYPQMAIAMGQDPSQKIYVPFVPESKKFVTNWFKYVLDPVTDEGVSFWWLDWQQWMNSSITGLNPTFWLNYMFFTHLEMAGKSRPTILHRWGGLGNHRYQLGFSGDVVPTWPALEFQPYFTATAANVGFMWSHDIGGHTEPTPPELYTRWVQFGSWSPVFRTHCTKSPDNDRRIWVYPFENFQIMRNSIDRRSRLIPYIYTAAREGHDSGLAFVHSLYYEWPDFPDSYTTQNQYMFGSQIMVAPITSPIQSSTQLSQRAVWIPPGQWIEWESLNVYEGPMYINKTYALSETPVFVMAGSVLPMLPQNRQILGGAQQQYTSLQFTVFPYRDSSTKTTSRLYEDGSTDGSDYSVFNAWTNIDQAVDNQFITITVNPAVGSYPGMPTSRTLSFKIMGELPPAGVSVNGGEIPFIGNNVSSTGWYYDGTDLSVNVQILQPIPVDDSTQIVVKKNSLTEPLTKYIAGAPRCFSRGAESVDILDNHFPKIFQEDYTAVFAVSEMSNTIFQNPSGIVNLGSHISDAISQVNNLQNLDGNTKEQVITYLQDCYGQSW